MHGRRAGAVMYPARLGGRNAKRLTVRSVTPADLSQTMGNTTQQMTAQPQDPNEVVDILVELDDEPAAAVLAAQSLTPGIAAAEKTAAKGVSRAFVAGSYTLPTVEQADTQALQVALATNQFTGKGMTIAVLDTGLDTAHPAFTNASADAKFTKDYVSGILQAADLNAEALMPGVTADDVYLSAKIPFAFDYAGKDAQVAPGSKWDAANLEHGTHVAGISAGYAVDGEGAVTFSGVAPDAQVIPMKVFDDSGTGAATITILAALEDAGRLGVDAVNLSLGSYGGFTVDEDALINDVYNKLDAAGIMVITAAGNETSSSYMNSYGTDAPLTGDPDNSVVVAAPSVYPANLSIASVEGQEIYANYVLLGDEKNTYTDSQTSFLGLDSYVSLLKIYGDVSDDLAAPYDYVMVPGYGADSDYEGIDVTGKIAVVQRGGTDENGEPITFVTKIQNALTAEPVMLQLLPLERSHFAPLPPALGDPHGEVELFPDAWSVFKQMAPIYMHGMIFGAMTESYCAEQSARMTAMDSATKSATDMIHALQLEYNRTRQGAITQEITEIIGGASAVQTSDY